jgi:hypothetical protein
MITSARPKSWLLLILVVWLLGSGVGWAQERKSTSDLRQVGIDADSFQPISWSHNEKWLAAFDEAPFEEKKDGVFFRLWLLEIGSNGAVNRFQKVPLKLASFLQGEFTPNDDAFVILGNRGTTFERIDLKSFAVETLIAPEAGKAGFRADPAILWTEGGSMYSVGFPYDEARFINARTIAAVNPRGSGAAAFKAGPDLSTLEKTIERMWFSNYLSPTSIFYGQKYSDLVVLSHWDGSKMSEFDRATRMWGSWGNSGRILYSVERTKDLSELLLFDSKSGAKTVLASGSEVYRYLFLSRDGATALVSLMVPEGRRLSTFFARAGDGWKLRPLEADSSGRPRTVAAGWMRLSSKGGLLAHVSAAGLAIYPLPR